MPDEGVGASEIGCGDRRRRETFKAARDALQHVGVALAGGAIRLGGRLAARFCG
jgi:hypothetical protein